jgi:D-glycero-D-manno-heptose 1,7-bisphosphate phosphatase
MLENILCDRDGTIIYDRHYLRDPAQMELLPGAAEGLRRLAGAGKKIFVLSNQSGIGRGLLTEEQYLDCARRLDELLQDLGAKPLESLHCPHNPENGPCGCRKPATGMWETLRRARSLKPENSVMLGDKGSDIAFGKNAGLAASILVLSGDGEKTLTELGLPLNKGDRASLLKQGFFLPPASARPGPFPDCVAADLSGAAAYILYQSRKR